MPDRPQSRSAGATHLAMTFESIVAQILRAHGFDVEQSTDVGDRGTDLILTSPTGKRAVVEVKLFRSQSAPTSMLLQAARMADSARSRYQANAAILVVGSTVSANARQAIQNEHPGVVLYDFASLASLAAQEPAVLQSLERLVRESGPFSDFVEIGGASADVEKDIAQRSSAPLQPPQAFSPLSEGARLCKEIREIKAGKRRSRDFEQKLTEALQYVFSEDLTAWSPQKATDTRMSQYDLIARVASTHDFWQMVVSHFRSRYVVFEFKNYEELIKQGQIYTTEKYLYASALRATAFIISRKGADANAHKAARGALREAGKLIVLLSVEDICQMLALRDAAEDHNGVLVEHVDGILTKLER